VGATVSYESPQFGRYDPAVLVQARKRIAAATETWSALAGGDTNRFKVATDQFSLVADSILKLHPESGDLARAMVRAIETTVRSAEPPTPAPGDGSRNGGAVPDAAYDDIVRPIRTCRRVCVWHSVLIMSSPGGA
jgi:chemosensory pili system protein ChpA (sensor histidine kinase/response regulator)